ncbi:DoxX family protein [Melissospora conviva]|uniref:DoxX family protein n=1 Tax=Melissospora conviva TaxID=3388432 RepID=UPI003C26C6ED
MTGRDSALPRRRAGERARTIGRWALGGMLAFAGTAHLTFQRQEFQAQVPEWIPIGADAVVLASGVVEIALGAALVALPRHRRLIGAATAAFFVGVFPGNIAQYVEGTDAFGLDTDRARLIRLFFQPLLVGWALWAGEVLPRRRAPHAGHPGNAS